MHEPWITIVTVQLVALGVLAELNLLRVFLGDWRKGRREERQRLLRPGAQARGAVQPARQGRHWQRRPLIAAGILALVPGAASSAARPEPEEPAPRILNERAGEFLLRNSMLSFSIQPAEQPPEDSKPLSIAADRPGFSDSSSIVPTGHLQLETGYTFTFRDRNGVETQTHNGPELLARVGILDDRFELRVATSGYAWSRGDSGSGFDSVEGFSDLSAGFKLKITDQDGLVPRVCLEAMSTVGTDSRTISNRDLEPTLKLIGSWDLGHSLSLTSNAILTYASSNSERFLQGAGSVSISYAATDTLSVFAEYFVVGPHFKATDAAQTIDFGAAYLLTNRIQFDARVGFGLNREADNLFAGMGISFLF